ncbi:MAG: M50 family metallopeptidase [Deltaproteobacteria bacterium]|nr:M50 family metallopeptidase [Deltaproteobacteria bacterium]
MAISDPVDRVVGWLKWPTAFLSLVFLPGMLYALTFVVRDLGRRPGAMLPLLAGAGVFLAVWLVVLRPRTALHPVVTVQHELTHALLALLTLHPVQGFGAALRGGGHARYVGRGSWLIAIAPFVVPLFAVLVMIAAHWFHSPRAISGLLGLTLAWHIVGNWAPAHRHHSDHREAGRIFSFLFVTCANLLVLGIVLAYATGARSLTGHLDHVRGPTRAFFGWIVKLLAPG